MQNQYGLRKSGKFHAIPSIHDSVDVEPLPSLLDDQCFVFPNDKEYCNTEKYTLKFFVNGEQVDDIIEYEPIDDDKILISFGDETPEEIESQLLELQGQQLVK